MSFVVQKLSEFARAPTRGPGDPAGHDLYCADEEVLVPAQGGPVLVRTDIAIISFPPETYAQIAPRSGLALNHGIDVGAGVVDRDYRGNIGVILFNHGKEDYVVRRGDRIAQLIFLKYESVQVVLASDAAAGATTSTTTVRGAAGFGSSGK